MAGKIKNISTRPRVDVASKDTLEKLIAASGGPHLSIFIHTEISGEKTRKNPIKLKTKLDEASKLLQKEGRSKTKARNYLKKGYDLVEDNAYWQHQSGGLLFYLSDKELLTFRIPRDFKEKIILADSFHIKPLITYLSAAGVFYLLALSQDSARLFQCTSQIIAEVDPEDMPQGLDDALKYEDPEREMQFHTKNLAGGKGGGNPAVFHGQGMPDEQEKNRIKRYFGKTDQALQKFFDIEKPPLVIAAVDYLHPIYKEASDYNNILEEGIKGSPEKLKDHKLHKKAWDIVEPHFKKDKEAALDIYRTQRANDNTTEKLEGVIRQAHLGNIATLFIARDEEKWGVYNPNTDVLQSHAKQKPESTDLLDLAACKTLLANGRVFVLENDDIPSDTGIAALLRY